MEKFEREFQSGALWKNYEYWKMNQKIAEMMRTFSHTTTEIVNDSNSLDREWEFEVQ